MKTITYNRLNSLYRFFNQCDNFVFLDTSKSDERNRRSLLFVEPLERLQLYHGQDEKAYLQKVQAVQEKGYALAGWLSYEFGYLLEPSLAHRLSRPTDEGELLADLGVFESFYSYDHLTGETNFPIGSQETIPFDGDGYHVENLRASINKEQYLQALAKILDYIEAGDTYQVNYTLKLLFNFIGSPEQFYADLRRNQSVSYGAYIRWHDQRIMSFSPELFFWKKGGNVTVKPMKGTMKRGNNLEEDSSYRQFLRTDIKNQSENVMIVDLLRNDLGHLMHHLPNGDVQVDSLFDVETYETLLQMTSTITGRSTAKALDEVKLQTFLEAIFPCGSVTGAPKIRTMEIIDELENDRRGVYTGAIGCLLPGGEAVFSVPIRTIVLNGTEGEMGIGSGIVHDSDPLQEWQECLLKGHFLTQPQEHFQLIETILWHPQYKYFLLDRHLERLQRSAEYFLFHCNLNEIEIALKQQAKHFGPSATRLRLLLEKDGSFTVDVQTCCEPAHLALPLVPDTSVNIVPRIALSREIINNSSFWFFHKTTQRQLYDNEYRKALDNGLFEVIFQNDKGCITEGCITNIFIYSDGIYKTPPIIDGLLAGTMRRNLLEKSQVQVIEQSLTIDDIKQAEAIFLCNSVRGVVQVAL